MKKAIITGATGMVGGIVQRELLAAPEIEKVTSIVRRSSGVSHPKLEEIIHSNFLDYSEMMAHFSDQDIAIFCIGAYAGQVPDDKFKMITFDFVKSFADALKTGSPNSTFCLLSGAGADQKEKSRMSFAKYKGMAENYLIDQDFDQLYLFRPGYIYPVEKRDEPNLMYRVSRKLYPFLNKVYPQAAITSEVLAKSMVKAGLEGAQKMILENQDIKAV